MLGPDSKLDTLLMMEICGRNLVKYQYIWYQRVWDTRENSILSCPMLRLRGLKMSLSSQTVRVISSQGDIANRGNIVTKTPLFQDFNNPEPM